jgi:hypothetical protein
MNYFKTLCIFVVALNLYACEASTEKKTNTDSAVENTTTTAKKAHTIYPTISAMIDSSGDYASDNGTFKIISENPLHIQISKIVMPDTPIDELKKGAMEGIVYIAYQAFASTGIKDITITAVPLIYDATNDKKLGFSEPARYTATISRDKAQEVMQKIVGITNFDDLLGYDAGEGQYVADSPAPAFEKLKSEDTIEEVLALLTKK